MQARTEVMATATVFPLPLRNNRPWIMEPGTFSTFHITDTGHPVSGTLSNDICGDTRMRDIINKDLTQVASDDTQDSRKAAQDLVHRPSNDNNKSGKDIANFVKTCSNMGIPLNLSSPGTSSTRSIGDSPRKKLSLGRIPRYIECFLCVKNIKEDNFSEHLLFGPVICSFCGALFKDCKEFQFWFIEYSMGDFSCNHDLQYLYDSPSYLIDKLSQSVVEDRSQKTQTLELIKKYIDKLTSLKNQAPWKYAILKCKEYLAKAVNLEENRFCSIESNIQKIIENTSGATKNTMLETNQNCLNSAFPLTNYKSDSEVTLCKNDKIHITEEHMEYLHPVVSSANKNKSQKLNESSRNNARLEMKSLQQSEIPNLVIKKTNVHGKHVFNISEVNEKMVNKSSNSTFNFSSSHREKEFVTESPESYLSRVGCQNLETDTNVDTATKKVLYTSNQNVPQYNTVDQRKHDCALSRSETSGSLKVRIKIPKNKKFTPETVQDQPLSSMKIKNVIKPTKKIKRAVEKEVPQAFSSSKIKTKEKLTEKIYSQGTGVSQPSRRSSALTPIQLVENDYYLVSKTAIDECPVCYETLCPSMMTVNAVNFLITVVCEGCNLTIYIPSPQICVVTNGNLASHHETKIRYTGPRSRRRLLAPQKFLKR